MREILFSEIKTNDDLYQELKKVWYTLDYIESGLAYEPDHISKFYLIQEQVTNYLDDLEELISIEYQDK